MSVDLLLKRFADAKVEHIVFEVKVPRFSEILQFQRKEVLLASGNPHLLVNSIRLFTLEVYPNGLNGNEGYVSIVLNTHKFSGELYLLDFQFSCIVGALDTSREKRFPTSFAFVPQRQDGTDVWNPFVLHRVLKHKTLLSEPDDLLPGDCLTLHIDGYISKRSYEPKSAIQHFVSESFEYRKPDGHILRLDSKLGKHLIESSPYFQLMSETLMVEKQCGYTIFSSLDFTPFKKVCYILEGIEKIEIRSCKHLRSIYAAADKYDVPFVIASCRGIFSAMFQAAENDPIIRESIYLDIPQLLEVVDRCNDVKLKEIVERFLERDQKCISTSSLTPESTQNGSETEWSLENGLKKKRGFFVFLKGTQEKEEGFDFYQ